MNNFERKKREREQGNNNKFCEKKVFLVKSTLRVPVGQSGWKWYHSLTLILGYITVSRKLSICEVKNPTY